MSVSPPRRRVGFFDVDTREEPAAGATCHVFRPRARPEAARFERVLEVASRAGVTAATRCLQACRGPDPGLRLADGLLSVPMDADPEALGALIRAHRAEIARVELDKRSRGCSEENVRARAYDVFAVNRGARAVVEGLGLERWVVFGSSVHLCVASVVRGLRDLGADVSIVSDALVDRDPATIPGALARFREEGVRLITTGELREEFGAGGGATP